MISKKAQTYPFKLIIGVIILLVVLTFVLVFSYTQTGSITGIWQDFVGQNVP